MTLLGHHTADEFFDLVNAKDSVIKTMSDSRASFQWNDATAASDWDSDFATLRNRYDSAVLKGKATIIAETTSSVPLSMLPVEDEYQAVLAALSKTPGSTQKGDLQDLSNRLQIAGAQQDFSAMPQPQATDLDLQTFQATGAVTTPVDTTAAAADKAAHDKAASIAASASAAVAAEAQKAADTARNQMIAAAAVLALGGLGYMAFSSKPQRQR